MYYSPKTSTDGLVFHYDTGNTVRSYLGEPTTNYVPGTFDYGLYAYASGPVDTTVLNEKNKSITAKRYTITQAVNTARAAIFPTGLTTGVAYTFSFKWKYNGSTTASPSISVSAAKGNPETNNNNFTSQTTDTVSIGNGWYLTTYTFVFSSNPTGGSILTFGISTSSTSSYIGETFDIYEAQFEVKAHRTPYASGTRSATQGLKDLTGGSTIDISPTSFNSNAEIEYDGTNDYIYVGSKTWSFPNGATVEQVIKPLTLNREQGFFTLNNYGAGSYINFWMPTSNTMRWEVIGTTSSGYSTINGTTVFQTGRYYHVVGTFNGTTTKIYINGIEENSQTMANQPTSMTAQMDIGRYDTSYPSSAQIPVTKFYTRPLTAAEVQRNFNAVKSRFNIA